MIQSVSDNSWMHCYLRTSLLCTLLIWWDQKLNIANKKYTGRKRVICFKCCFLHLKINCPPKNRVCLTNENELKANSCFSSITFLTVFTQNVTAVRKGVPERNIRTSGSIYQVSSHKSMTNLLPNYKCTTDRVARQRDNVCVYKYVYWM